MAMTTRVVVTVKMVMMGWMAAVAAWSDHKKAVLSTQCLVVILSLILDIAVRVRNDRYYVKLSLILDFAIRVTNDYVKLLLILHIAVP